LTNRFTTILKIAQNGERQEQEFAIILYAPAEISVSLDDIRRRYDPGFALKIPPHITIKRPASLGNPDNLAKLLATLSQKMENVAASTRLFEVELEGYSIFHKQDSNVVFLKIKNEEPLIELHKKIIHALSEVFPNGHADSLEYDNYHPHLTIGNKLSDIELAVMKHELDSGNYQLNFNFTAHEIGLLAQPPVWDGGHFIWDTIASFTFAG
jgi:2'-5' RNA ligase